MTADAIDDAETRVRLALNATGLDFDIFPCDPALADTAVFCEHYGYPADRSANTIVVKAKTGGERYAVCVLLADSRLDVNKVVRKRLGARRVSFASAEETKRLTGMEIGGVTPVGLPDGLPVWVDARVMQCDYIILGGGSRACKVKVSPEVFGRIPNADAVDGLAMLMKKESDAAADG